MDSMVIFSLIIAIALVLFLTVLAVLVISESIKSVKRTLRLKRKGIEKETRNKIFKRLRSIQNQKKIKK